LDLRQLRYFVGVVEAQSFSGAARNLNITQPALGMQVASLEGELGAPLLKRHSRGVTLTPQGATLLGYAREMVRLADRAREEVKCMGETLQGDLTIGVTPTIARTLMPDLLLECSVRYPDVQLHFTQGFSDDLKRDFTTGKLDLVISGEKPDHDAAACVPLFRECLYLVGAIGTLSKEDGVTFADVAKLPIVLDSHASSIRELTLKAASQAGLSLINLMSVDPVAIRREIVLRHRKFTIAPYGLLSDEIARGTLQAWRIVDPTIERTMFLMRQGDCGRLARTVADIVKELVTLNIKSNQYTRWQAAKRERTQSPSASPRRGRLKGPH